MTAIQAPKGGKWSRSTIRRILSNPAYRGIQASRVWVADPLTSTFRFEPDNPQAIIVEDAHQPIVSHELWEAAKASGIELSGASRTLDWAVVDQRPSGRTLTEVEVAPSIALREDESGAALGTGRR